MSDDNVVHINQAKGKKNKNQNCTKEDVLLEAVAMLHPEHTFEKTNLKLRGLDVRLVELESGTRLWARAKENVLSYIDSEVVENKLSSAIHSMWPTQYNFKPKDIRDCVGIAKQTAESMDNIAAIEKLIVPESAIVPVRFFSDEGWTWHRLPYDPDTTDDEARAYWETEVFPRFKKNFSSFMAWCGSLFDPKSPRALCPWIYGEGETGKGTLAVFIQECMGESGGVINPDTFSFDKFALESVIGKRLIFIDECPAKLPTSGTFKRFTGEKTQLVNRKGIKAVKMRIDAKTMMASNHFPEIKAGKEFARRIMPVPFQEIVAPMRNKEEVNALMHRYGAHFWGIAMEEYAKDKELRNYDKSEIMEYQEDMNEIIDLWIMRNIELDKKVLTPSVFPVRYVIDAAKRDRLEWKKVRERLQEISEVKVEARYFRGVSAKCIVGATWKGSDLGFKMDDFDEEIDF
jgi:hypothetical protein